MIVIQITMKCQQSCWRGPVGDGDPAMDPSIALNVEMSSSTPATDIADTKIVLDLIRDGS